MSIETLDQQYSKRKAGSKLFSTFPCHWIAPTVKWGQTETYVALVKSGELASGVDLIDVSWDVAFQQYQEALRRGGFASSTAKGYIRNLTSLRLHTLHPRPANIVDADVGAALVAFYQRRGRSAKVSYLINILYSWKNFWTLVPLMNQAPIIQYLDRLVQILKKPEHLEQEKQEEKILPVYRNSAPIHRVATEEQAQVLQYLCYATNIEADGNSTYQKNYHKHGYRSCYLDRWDGPDAHHPIRNQVAGKCSYPGCTETTRNQKDFCIRHIEHSPYVDNLMARMDQRIRDDQEVLMGGSQAVKMESETAKDIIAYLRATASGELTLDALAKKLGLDKTLAQKYAFAMRDRDLIHLSLTSRHAVVITWLGELIVDDDDDGD